MTGFNPDGSINLEIIEPYARMLSKNGISGVFVNGSTGQGLSLSVKERNYLAERWANNHAIPFVVFSEQWNNPRPGLQDSGRGEAPTSLTDNLLDSATHILAFPSPTSKWTRTVIDLANERGIPLVVREVE